MVLTRLRTIALTLYLIFLGSLASAWETGDIIFHESTSPQSRVIQQVTGSRYSHMGMIVKRGEETFVLEAIHRVSLTPLKQFIDRGVDGHYVVKRLRPEYLPSRVQWEKIEDLTESWIGLEYDLVFGWSDEKMYCSELIWKLYKRGAQVRIGELVTFADLDLSQSATQALIRSRTNSLDLNERIVTPQAMFNSDKLTLVLTNP